jgi:O-antigen ligase
MSKHGGARRPHRKKPGPTEAAGLAGILLAIAASWFAIDPRAIDSFQAPKELLAAAGLSAAAVAALVLRLRRGAPLLPRPRGAARLVLALFLGAAAFAAVSAWRSPRGANALDSLRMAGFFLLALPVGASDLFEKHRRAAVAAFCGGAAINAALAILAFGSIYSPITVYGQFRRAGLGAFLGNAGHLGLALALAAVTLLGPVSRARGKRRGALFAVIALLVAGIAVTQTLTALGAVFVGFAIAAAGTWRRRAILPLASAAVALAALTLAFAPTRSRLLRAAQAASQGDWNRALTARAAPWLAATEMIRSRPVLGVGPGNFGAEFIPARLSAEARVHRRLVVPGVPRNSFTQAHNDYLDLAATAGIPAALMAVSAFALLLGRLAARGGPDRAWIAATLGTGAVAAIVWFPFQIPTVALWLLLLCGAGFRGLREEA